MKRNAYPSYTDSAIEWLGRIPVHWGTKKLKYLSTVNDDILSEGTEPDCEILYIDISSVDAVNGIIKKEGMTFQSAPSRARRKVQDGDVIMSTVRTYLRAIAPIIEPESNMVVSTGFAVVRPGQELNCRFAAYALRAPYFVDSVVARSVGVSYPAINATEMTELPIALASIHEQSSIAAYLDRETSRIDELIAKKERQIELLQEKCSALISHVVTKGLDPNVKMKDSGVEWLGEIPTGWEIKKLKYLGSALIGLTYSPADVVEETHQGQKTLVLRASNIRNNRISLHDNVYISSSVPQDLLIREGDILICARNGSRDLVGKNAYIRESMDSVSFGAFMAVFRSSLNRFLSYMFNSSLFKYQSTGFLTSTINQLTNNNLNGIVVPVPPGNEQDEIAAFLDHEVSRNEELATKLRKSIDLLREYRTALISAAVTGKIDVREEAPQCQ